MIRKEGCVNQFATTGPMKYRGIADCGLIEECILVYGRFLYEGDNVVGNLMRYDLLNYTWSPLGNGVFGQVDSV